MSYTGNEMRDLALDVASTLEKNSWVSSYEIYIQSISRVKHVSVNLDHQFTDLNQFGLALRLISKSRRMKELSINSNDIPLLDKLREPKSTQHQITVSEFSPLRKPRFSAIMGDGSANFDHHQDLSRFMESWGLVNNEEYPLQIEKQLDIIHESRLIMNSSSDSIRDTSMRVNYAVALQLYKKNEIYQGKAEVRTRNLEIDVGNAEEVARESLERNILPTATIKQNLSGIILHPQVAGMLVASFMNSTFLNSEIEQSWNWSEQLNLYDDPHRAGGYYSTIFDDEGSLTRSKLLIEGGEVRDGLFDRQSRRWKEGGNGYRVASFQPIPRSYKYQIRRYYTNIVLYGGIGIGERFMERRGKNLEITQGHVYTLGDPRNPSFVIHVKEAYLWEDSSFVGPVNGVTVTGKIGDLMKSGQFSKEQHVVATSSNPGAVYVGWIYLQAGLAMIRWN